jgi:hypothetical protein
MAATPRTAPKLAPPQTPTKDCQGVTPLTAAAFRRQRSSLARTMFDRCGYFHLLRRHA